MSWLDLIYGFLVGVGVVLGFAFLTFAICDTKNDRDAGVKR